MKTYVITLSQVFPSTHPRAGEQTGFKDKFFAAIKELKDEWWKLHTIRANYKLWKKRFEQIERGEACLSVRQWSGKPYRSKQIELVRLTREDGIGLQVLTFYRDRDGVASLKFFNVNGRYQDSEHLAKNDGLTVKDWRDWFRYYDLSKPMAIIHFTKFRY